MTEPWLTVVMPVYNGAHYLEAALESVVLQNETGIEIVAVDDGSTDGSLDLLRLWSRRLPIRIERPPRSGNWVKVTNHALAIGRGEYACFLHQDDLWKPGRLAAIRKVLEAEPATDFVLHGTEYLDQRGRGLGFYRPPFRQEESYLSAVEALSKFLVQNVIAIPSALFRRSVALECDGLDERLWYSADWDLWLRLAARGRTKVLAQILACYRLHRETQTTLRSTDLPEFRRQHEMVLERHLPRWASKLPDSNGIAARARFSVEMNLALASLAARTMPDVVQFLRFYFSIGLVGFYKYLRDSCLLERVAARLRGRLWRSASDRV